MNRNINRFIQIFTIASLSIALSACGFHLRGEYLLPEGIDQVSLTSYDEYSTVTKALRKQLRNNDIEIVAPGANVPNIDLISESDSEDDDGSDSDSTLSIYQNGRTAEKQLNYTVVYQVTLPGKGTQKLSSYLSRSYLDNPQASLAKSIEEDLLLDEMREETAVQIMRQLARLKDTNHAAELEAVEATAEQAAIDTGEAQAPQRPARNLQEAMFGIEEPEASVESANALQAQAQDEAQTITTLDDTVTLEKVAPQSN